MSRGFAHMRRVVAIIALATAGCAGVRSLDTRSLTPNLASQTESTRVYQPLALGDAWKYVCNHQFTIRNAVIGRVRVGKKLTYEFQIQIPRSPSRSVKIVQLLANDASGATRIYGYLLGGKVRAVRPTAIVVSSPVLHRHYDYPGPNGKSIRRVFVGFENTNPTPLGIFYVAPYFETNATHNYGYTLGRGIMEEDHGPNYRYDRLIDHVEVR
jgi:hypothetical protein